MIANSVRKSARFTRVRVAALSSTASEVKPVDFVNQRIKYSEQLSSMRKGWALEIDERNAQEARRAAAEKEKVVLAKAIRLREKRKQSAVRQAADKALKIKANEAYKQHLANNLVVREERVEKQDRYHAALAATYTEERDHWLTAESIDEVITEQFFDAPNSTGLRFLDSEHWRYAVHTLKIKRFQDGETEDMREFTLSERLDHLADMRANKKLIVHDFLDPLIGNGEQRAQYNEILEETFNTLNKDEYGTYQQFDEVDEHFDDELDEVDTEYSFKSKVAGGKKYSEGADEEWDEDDDSDSDSDSDDEE